jgi:hypothetical protein
MRSQTLTPQRVESVTEPESPFIHCDRDQSCDWAKFKVITRSGPLFLCGHHFHENELAFIGQRYEVKNLNA